MTGGFAALYGQPALWQALQRGFQTGMVVHAFLFLGPPGSGKETAARVLAQAALCTGEQKPCGLCSACKRVAGFNHPDFLTLSIPEDKKSIGVEETREILARLRMSAFEGGRRVVLLRDVQAMTPEAQNTLLKTIEEPAEGTILLLTATQRQAVLPTIQSRCLVITMGRLPFSDFQKGFAERSGDMARVKELYQRSDGILGRALALQNDEKGEALRALCARLLATLTSPAGLPAASRELAALDRPSQAAFLDEMELALRGLLHARFGLAEETGKMRRFTIAALHSMMEETLSTRKRLNANEGFAAAVEPLLEAIAGG